MKRLNPTTRNYIILSAILIINVISFAAGVLPPAGRANYLPHTLLATIQLLLLYFMFGTPLVCLGGILFSGVQIVREHLSHKGYLIFGTMFVMELLIWWLVFGSLMSI